MAGLHLIHVETRLTMNHGMSKSTPFNEPQSIVYAIMTGNVMAVRLLARLGAVVSIDDAWVVYEACLSGCEMLQALSLNTKIDLNPAIPGQMGDTVLHFVVRSPPSRFRDDKRDIIAILLLRGANAWERDRLGCNALHIAATSLQHSDEEGYSMMQLFFGETTHALPMHIRNRFTAEIDDVDNDGNTALMLAVLQNNIKCVHFLLSHGANPLIKGQFGKPPLFFASSRNFSQLSRMLVDYGADLPRRS